MKAPLRLALMTTVLLVAAWPGPAAADPVEPHAFIAQPTDGAYFPQGANELFGFYCMSDPSFVVVSCEGSQPLGSAVDTANAGPHTLSVTATSYDGQQTTATSTYTVIDVTRPHVEFRTPSNGATYELGADVTYDYGCADDPGGLGIELCAAGNGAPSGMPLDTHHLGTFTFDVYAVDWAFNLSHESVTYTVVDRTPPVITIGSPSDGATYTLGQEVYALYSCDDGPSGSGPNGCKGDLPSGSRLDTSTYGTKTFKVTAYDRAGNVATKTNTYSVVYDFSGFVSPAAPYPTAAPMKAGENVPLKFSLNGDKGLDVVAAGSPVWAACGSDAANPADGSLSYNGSNDRYTYLASTSKSWAGTCRDLVLTLRDGTVHRARFAFGK